MAVSIVVLVGESSATAAGSRLLAWIAHRWSLRKASLPE
jgi:hypothetical protein